MAGSTHPVDRRGRPRRADEEGDGGVGAAVDFPSHPPDLPESPVAMPSLRIVVLLVVSLLASPAPAADRPPEGGEHSFSDAIVVFTLEYEDDLLPAPPWALADARIRRLGNVFFLTGVLPDGVEDPGGAPVAARRYWIPLADIVRMTEFDDVESALESLDLDGGGDDVGRPVNRRIAGSPRRTAHQGRGTR